MAGEKNMRTRLTRAGLAVLMTVATVRNASAEEPAASTAPTPQVIPLPAELGAPLSGAQKVQRLAPIRAQAEGHASRTADAAVDVKLLRSRYASEKLAYNTWRQQLEVERDGKSGLAWSGVAIAGAGLVGIGFGIAGSFAFRDEKDQSAVVASFAIGVPALVLGGLLATYEFLTRPTLGPETYEQAKQEAAAKGPGASPKPNASLLRVPRESWSLRAPFTFRF